MKKILLLCICLVCILATPIIANAEDVNDSPIKTSAKSAYLIDSNLSEEVYSYNATARYPIASMVKIMTALIAFEEVDRGNATIDELVSISANAMSMGGSQMFLEEGLSYPFGDLLKGIIVVSANDACVAVAERIAGSEEAFVSKMNEKAEQLNMNDTHFANCTGLPCVGGYSCAKDCAVMLAELLKHSKYHDYSKIWLEDYVHPDGRTTCFTNTNKLIRFYEGCDGGKTGFTNEAGFCLTATAIRNGLRMISVVIGESDSKVRFEDSKKLLNYAFANYKKTILAKSGEVIGELRIKGARNTVSVTTNKDIGFFSLKSKEDNAKLIVEFNDNLNAPLEKGTVVGYAISVKEGKEVERAELITLDDAVKERYGDAIERVLGFWGVNN